MSCDGLISLLELLGHLLCSLVCRWTVNLAEKCLQRVAAHQEEQQQQQQEEEGLGTGTDTDTDVKTDVMAPPPPQRTAAAVITGVAAAQATVAAARTSRAQRAEEGRATAAKPGAAGAMNATATATGSLLNGVCHHMACSTHGCCIVAELEQLERQYMKGGTEFFRGRALRRGINIIQGLQRALQTEQVGDLRRFGAQLHVIRNAVGIEVGAHYRTRETG